MGAALEKTLRAVFLYEESGRFAIACGNYQVVIF